MDQEQGGAGPATLGRYLVQGRLGVGPLGELLLGVDESGRRAAIRVVHPQLAVEPGFRGRFRREVQVAATAPAWFVAPVLDADPDAELPWLATAYVEGPPLHVFVAEHGSLGRQGTIALAVRLAEGLAALHGAGLAHRDLKPSNVILAQDGPRLVDFGIARAADGTAYARAPVLGAPAFLSPELIAGVRDVGPPSDVFSFGSVIGFAALGHSPFAAESRAAEAHRVATAHPDLGLLDTGLREVVQACLAKDPAARPSAAQLRDRLRALEAAAPDVTAPAVAQHTTVGPPVLPTAGAHRRRRGLVTAFVAAGIAGAAIALIAIVLLNRPGGGAPAQSAAPPPRGAPSIPAAPTSEGGVEVFDAATNDRFGTDIARFATPSGNIACLVESGVARCDVRQRNWQVPEPPADCDGAYGTGAVLSAGREGELSCVSDTVADRSLRELEYGQGVRLGDILCVSRETGVRCEDERSGHGFEVARASYELF